MLNLFQRKNYKVQAEIQKKINIHLHNKLERLESESINLHELNTAIEIINTKEHYTLVGVETNKNDEFVFICEYYNENSVSILLLFHNTLHSSNQSTIECAITEGNSKSLRIDDITIFSPLIGNGSIAMKYLFKTAEKINARYMYGMLSESDKDHFDMLEHFYKKFGFEVKFNEDKTNGRIKKIV